jgi:hypothetical protein
MSKNCFVFVVCGSQEHIDTLHFSLTYLKRFSEQEILVLTDSSRNETPIIHDNIIDVQTPAALNHHQASIYLKTGIFQFVPKGNLYCYLDSDIIAFSKEVDHIFTQYQSPISFAPDHCKMLAFSSYAVNCTCQKMFKEARDRFESALDEVDPYRNSSDEMVKKYRRKLQIHYHKLRKNKMKAVITALRYFLAPKVFKLKEDINFDKKQRVWKNADEVIFMKDFNIRKVAKNCGLGWSTINHEPVFKSGISLWKDECFHLKELIKNKFDIDITVNDFQHWNGGVFLFDDQSFDFLKNWFDFTMEIFKDSKWKTRDQGTLIATVWKFQLQNHPTLNKKWNLIADYYNQELEWLEKTKIQLHEDEVYEPKLIHVYHHFQDTNWEFWNQLIENLKE